MKHLMIDLETLGHTTTSAILSIGAVEFDLNSGETGREFYQIVDLQSCLDLGLTINASTFYWWMKESDSARNEICKQGLPIYRMLLDLTDFIKELDPNVCVWGNSASFDLSILENAYIASDNKIPWGFRNERDVRTLVSFAPEIKNNCKFNGVTHNPIDDCKHQIKYCSAIWNKLKH